MEIRIYYLREIIILNCATKIITNPKFQIKTKQVLPKLRHKKPPLAIHQSVTCHAKSVFFFNFFRIHLCIKYEPNLLESRAHHQELKQRLNDIIRDLNLRDDKRHHDWNLLLLRAFFPPPTHFPMMERRDFPRLGFFMEFHNFYNFIALHGFRVFACQVEHFFSPYQF